MSVPAFLPSAADGRTEVEEWMDGWRWWFWGRMVEGGQTRERGKEGREDEKGGFCLVISIRSLPSGAVVRWLAGRPEGPTACAGPPTRRRSDPGCRLGCSGRSSWRLPGRRPPRFHLCVKRHKSVRKKEAVGEMEEYKQKGYFTLELCRLTFSRWLPETTDLGNMKQTSVQL